MYFVLFDEQGIDVLLGVVVFKVLDVFFFWVVVVAVVIVIFTDNFPAVVLHEGVRQLGQRPVALVVVVREHEEKDTGIDFQMLGDDVVGGVEERGAVVEIGLQLRVDAEDLRVEEALCKDLCEDGLEGVVVELLLDGVGDLVIEVVGLPQGGLLHGELDALVGDLFVERELLSDVCPVEMVLDHAVGTAIYAPADREELLVVEVDVEARQDYYEEGHDCGGDVGITEKMVILLDGQVELHAFLDNGLLQLRVVCRVGLRNTVDDACEWAPACSLHGRRQRCVERSAEGPPGTPCALASCALEALDPDSCEHHL